MWPHNMRHRSMNDTWVVAWLLKIVLLLLCMLYFSLHMQSLMHITFFFLVIDHGSVRLKSSISVLRS